MKKVIVLLAEGFEEIEAITPVNYLRRAGIEVIIAAIGSSLNVRGARGITLNADTTLRELIGQQDAGSWDAVIIPGGMPGASHIAASPEAGALITEMANAGKLICAICAAPVIVLSPLGLLNGKKFCCYPGMEKKAQSGTWTEDRVTIDGTTITSRAAGTAGEFAIAIIAELLGNAEAEKVARSVMLK